MSMIILALGVLAVLLIVMHMYSAVRFGMVIRNEVGSEWNSRGVPKPVAFTHSDLQTFRSNNKELVDGNKAVHRSVVRFERSWKYGMPMVLVLFIVAAMLQRIFPPA